MTLGWGYSVLVPLCHKHCAECTFCSDPGAQPAPDSNSTDSAVKIEINLHKLLCVVLFINDLVLLRNLKKKTADCGGKIGRCA